MDAIEKRLPHFARKILLRFESSRDAQIYTILSKAGWYINDPKIPQESNLELLGVFLSILWVRLCPIINLNHRIQHKCLKKTVNIFDFLCEN